MSGTTSNSERFVFPGWYIKLQMALLEQAPRPGDVSQGLAEALVHNQWQMKGVLHEALINRGLSLCFDAIWTSDITVPDDYDHDTYIKIFRKRYGKEFNPFVIKEDGTADKTVRLMPGQKFEVEIFKQQVQGDTTVEERIAFLQSQKAVFVGLHGALLFWEQLRRRNLFVGFNYASFNGDEVVSEDALCDNRATYLTHPFVSNWGLSNNISEGKCNKRTCILCFREKLPDA